MYVALEGLGRVARVDQISGSVVSSAVVGPKARHLSITGDGARIYAPLFVTPPLPGEGTGLVQTMANGQPTGGVVAVVNAATMAVESTIVLRHSDKPDGENQGRGVPNYLGAVAISPDGRSAWVPSKQDNILRGVLRDGLPLSFQNTVRAISSRIDLVANAEDYPRRKDHDNAGVASAIAFDRLGIFAFVALETSRQVAVIDVNDGRELLRLGVGRAPQGLAVSPAGDRLYVNNFMERTVSVFDLTALVTEGIADTPLLASVPRFTGEKLAANVLQGKRLFYDAQDTRLARDGYLSCAACHSDGGQDGRVWDITGFGEGLRNTVSLVGRAGAQGFLHWSNNFDEVQDFEAQIRNLSGGTGLMTDADFNAGTRSQPLGDPKAGVSADLDALAAYVKSLSGFARSPLRSANGSLTAAAAAGKALFASKNCSSCHAGTAFTISNGNNPRDVGTITAESGNRLGGPLTGIDVPTLRDVWNTAPFLHNGSAPTVGDAIRAHQGTILTDAELANLSAYVLQIGGDEVTAPTGTIAVPNTGTGLLGRYFNNMTLSGTPVMERTEMVNFGWATGDPGGGVAANGFSVRWTGQIEAISTGEHKFQMSVNDGVRLWVNGQLLVDSWVDRTSTSHITSAGMTLTKDQRYSITIEYYENTGPAVAKLRWLRPGQTTFAVVPLKRLYAN
jgi:DNA-binding beta-propeller fold protein YncE